MNYKRGRMRLAAGLLSLSLNRLTKHSHKQRCPILLILCCENIFFPFFFCNQEPIAVFFFFWLQNKLHTKTVCDDEIRAVSLVKGWMRFCLYRQHMLARLQECFRFPNQLFIIHCCSLHEEKQRNNLTLGP